VPSLGRRPAFSAFLLCLRPLQGPRRDPCQVEARDPPETFVTPLAKLSPALERSSDERWRYWPTKRQAPQHIAAAARISARVSKVSPVEGSTGIMAPQVSCRACPNPSNGPGPTAGRVAGRQFRPHVLPPDRLPLSHRGIGMALVDLGWLSRQDSHGLRTFRRMCSVDRVESQICDANPFIHRSRIGLPPDRKAVLIAAAVDAADSSVSLVSGTCPAQSRRSGGRSWRHQPPARSQKRSEPSLQAPAIRALGRMLFCPARHEAPYGGQRPRRSGPIAGSRRRRAGAAFSLQLRVRI